MKLVISFLMFMLIYHNIYKGNLQSSGSLILILMTPFIILLCSSNWFIYFVSIFFQINSGTIAIAYFIIGALYINILYLHIKITNLQNMINLLTIATKENEFNEK